MQELRRLAWSAALAFAATSPALAQTTGGNIGSPATQSAAIGNTTTGTTTTASNTTGASSSPTGATSTAQSTYKAAPTFPAPSSTTGNTNSAIAASNFLGNYFGSVYYQGSTPNQVPNTNPGGFGRATYNAATAGRTGAPGATGRAAGGRTSGSFAAGSDSPGIVAVLPRQIAYRATVQFKVPGGGMVQQLQSDLRSAIAKIPNDLVANPAGVQVMVDGRTVTLRGSVQDEEEAHTIVGMVRLTPGVGAIKNELAFPR